MRLPKCRVMILVSWLWAAFGVAAFAQTPLRLAVLDFQGDETGEVSALIRELVKERRPEFELLEPALVRVAAQGAGYSGNLNLPREEARALGVSLGCDFYLLGKVQIGRRLGEGERQYHEALLGLFAVETRTGHLTSFSFIREEAANEPEARRKLTVSVKNAWAAQVQEIFAARDKHLAEIADVTRSTSALIEVLNDGRLGQGSQQPVFYQRLKPEYTKEAEWAGITATVELEAVFQADGQVGEVTVTRWAGFGLDEAALATVRKLRFKPAQQAGKEVTIRGLVRYNFRRPPSVAERQAETEQLKRSLRELKSFGVKVPPQ